MKLSEALSILKENDYLTEFLNSSVTFEQLVNLLAKSNIVSKNIHIIDREGNVLAIQNPEEDLTEDDLYDYTDKLDKLITKLANFVKKYGWELKHTSYNKDALMVFNDECNAIEVLLYNRSEDTHDYGNVFYHNTTLSKEELIDSNKGLRVKTRFKEITDPKIYLVSAKLLDMNCDKVKTMYPGETILDKAVSYYCDHEFGDYLYKIILPNNYIVKKDAEHSDISQNSPEVYVTQNIPAKFIQYIGTIDEFL